MDDDWGYPYDSGNHHISIVDGDWTPQLGFWDSHRGLDVFGTFHFQFRLCQMFFWNMPGWLLKTSFWRFQGIALIPVLDELRRVERQSVHLHSTSCNELISGATLHHRRLNIFLQHAQIHLPCTCHFASISYVIVDNPRCPAKQLHHLAWSMSILRRIQKGKHTSCK